MTKYTINTKTDVNYRDNEDEMKTNYEDENKIDYRDPENVDLKIICNNTLLPPPWPYPYLAKNLVPKDIVSIVEFDMIQSSPWTNIVTTIIN